MFSDYKNNKYHLEKRIHSFHLYYILKMIFQGEFLKPCLTLPSQGFSEEMDERNPPFDPWFHHGTCCPLRVLRPPCLGFHSGDHSCLGVHFNQFLLIRSVEGQSGISIGRYSIINVLSPGFCQKLAVTVWESLSLSACLFYHLWNIIWFDYL